MQQVLERRDVNWKKLQQYVLDEREQIQLRGPSGTTLWGERRDYTWYIRDGFFVRSPLRVNGAAVPEPDRLRYEREFLDRERRRDQRPPAKAPDTQKDQESPQDVDALVRQSRQPLFISSAYFLRFTFDKGRYALVGREPLDGRTVLRIEYYPDKLFTPEARRERREEYSGDKLVRREHENDPAEQSYDAEMMRLMNKSSKVTLWIDPDSHQILKYFFPGQWLVQVDRVNASMTMGQPFDDVWLPRGVDVNVRLLMAFGNVDLQYTLQYDNYRQADVQMKLGTPDRP
jgi:hypothetical protein